MNEVFDAQQILFAKRLANSDLRLILTENRRSELAKGHKRRMHMLKKVEFDDDALAFAIFARNGELLLSDGKNGDNFIFEPKVGFSSMKLLNDDDKWRVFWMPMRGGSFIVAVGQELDYREDLVYGMVFGQMWIWFASLPFLLGVIIWIIHREMQRLRYVGQLVRQRKPEDNSKLPAHHVPNEILPLVESLNSFFERTSNSLLRERRFTSDAAHELRSPLAALRIQTEVAQMAEDDRAMREQALKNLTQGIDRATQLVEQLLTLSRLDNLKALENLQVVHWKKLIPSLLGELYFQAQKHQTELQFEHYATPPEQQGQPLLLSLMLRNIIDNAIRYCPDNSLIKVSLYQDRIVVEDNGGGVNDEDLQKLGQRFYRPAGQNEKGSGLGLSIVRRIAELHHYQVRLENCINTSQQKGLRVSILLHA
ncbi:MAG: quorum sensing histidine kinase QseC [[Pasteurella] mairii]|nr:quorum sensing histidine kinase QseC [[Pasteurella] mairii]